jgi:flagellar motor switch protein FliN
MTSSEAFRDDSALAAMTEESAHALAYPVEATATGSGDQRAWAGAGHEMVMGIPVRLRIVLGTARLSVGELMRLERGSIVALDQQTGGLVDIVANDVVIARGEIIVIDEAADRLAISIRELVPRSGP